MLLWVRLSYIFIIRAKKWSHITEPKFQSLFGCVFLVIIFVLSWTFYRNIYKLFKAEKIERSVLWKSAVDTKENGQWTKQVYAHLQVGQKNEGIIWYRTIDQWTRTDQKLSAILTTIERRKYFHDKMAAFSSFKNFVRQNNVFEHCPPSFI
jgi:hypothetical protein